MAAASLAVLAAVPASQPADASPANNPQITEEYGKLPLGFEANQGQADPNVKFLSRGSGYTLYLTNSGAVLALTKGNATSRPGKTEVLKMELPGANRRSPATAQENLPGATNYLIGNDPAKWRSGVPTYARVRYPGIYPGVDLVYYGNQRRLEFDFVIAPGGQSQAHSHPLRRS